MGASRARLAFRQNLVNSIYFLVVTVAVWVLRVPKWLGDLLSKPLGYDWGHWIATLLSIATVVAFPIIVAPRLGAGSVARLRRS
jgi:hypothetical protein